MGLFDSIISGNKKDKEDKGKRDFELIHQNLKSFTDELRTYIGEEFHVEKADENWGYLSKSKIVGVFPPTTFLYDKSELIEVQIQNLERFSGLVGIKGRTIVNSKLFDSVIKFLENKRESYRILLHKSEVAPMLIVTYKANINIAPIVLPE